MEDNAMKTRHNAILVAIALATGVGCQNGEPTPQKSSDTSPADRTEVNKPIGARQQFRPRLRMTLGPSSHVMAINVIAISPEGRLVATGGSDNRVKLWDIKDHRSLGTLTMHFGQIRAVRFSPDGKSVTSVDETGGIKISDIRSSTLLKKYDGPDVKSGCMITCDLDPKASTLVWEDSGEMHVWDITKERLIRKIRVEPPIYRRIAIGPKAKLVAWSTGTAVQVWDLETGKLTGKLSGDYWYADRIQFGVKGQHIAIADMGGTLRIWEIATGKLVSTIDMKQLSELQSVSSTAISNDLKRVAVAGDPNRVAVLDIGRRTLIASISNPFNVSKLSFTEDATVVVGSRGRTPIWANVAKEKSVSTFSWHRGEVSCAVISPDGKTLAIGGGFPAGKGSAALCDLSTQRPVAALRGTDDFVFSMIFTPDGRMLLSGNSNGWFNSRDPIKIWDPASGRLLDTLKQPHSSYSIAINRTGRLLASACDKDVWLWDLAKRKQISTLDGHTKKVLCVAYSPDGKWLASGGYDKTARVYDVATRKCVATVTHGDTVTSVAFSPNGSLLASVGGHSDIRLWRTSEFGQFTTLSNQAEVNAIAFSPDGRLIAAGTSGFLEFRVNVWDLERKSQIASLTGHRKAVVCVAFSPDGRTLVSGSRDETVRIWDLYAP